MGFFNPSPPKKPAQNDSSDDKDASLNRRERRKQEESAEKKALFSQKVSSGNFDPATFERAADALRNINNQPNSDLAFDMVVEAEKTKREEAVARQKLGDVEREKLRAETIKVQEQERRQTLQMEHRMARERGKEQHEMARKRDEENRQKQHQLFQREQKQRQQQFEREQQQKRALFEEQQRIDDQKHQRREKAREQQRMRIMEREKAIQMENDKQLLKMRIEAETRKERENFDLNKEMRELDLAEKKEEFKMELELRAKQLTEKLKFFSDFASSPAKMGMLTGAISLTFASFFGARYLERVAGMPKLVRDSSRLNYLRPTSWMTALRRRRVGNQATADALTDEIVLPPSVRRDISMLSRSLKRQQERQFAFRHVLLHGPPGTGKTLFAKRLALESGLDYAILSGGDVSSLGDKAPNEINKVFDWAEGRKGGTILFIDEAEAFLKKGRENAALGDNASNALTTFLGRTGTETTQFMIVLATNVPHVLDDAVDSRITSSVLFPLPGHEERVQLWRQYVRKNCGDWTSEDPSQKELLAEDFESYADEVFEELAHHSEGLAGREISSISTDMCVAVEGGLYEKIDKAAALEMLQRFKRQKALRKTSRDHLQPE